MSRYVIELAPSVWKAPWGGQHGRTTLMDAAKTYGTKRGAETALGMARRLFDREYPGAQIYPVGLVKKEEVESTPAGRQRASVKS